MRFIFLLAIGFFIFQSCSTSKNILQSNNHEENLKKLDKVYGKCNNPHRQIGSDTQKNYVNQNNGRLAQTEKWVTL